MPPKFQTPFSTRDHAFGRESGPVELYATRPGLRALASGMRQLAGTRTRYRRAHATPLAQLVSGRAEYNPNIEPPDE